MVPEVEVIIMKRTSFISRMIAFTLICTMLFSTAHASGEVDTATNYLVEHDIFVGDGNVTLNSKQCFTRPDLAVTCTLLA